MIINSRIGERINSVTISADCIHQQYTVVKTELPISSHTSCEIIYTNHYIQDSMHYQTDWLGTNPVYYNTKTGDASYNIDEVINFKTFEFHPEGFNNYLDFGYSVFGQTPIKNVRFLKHSSTLIINSDGSVCIEQNEDPVEDLIGEQTTERDVLDQIKRRVQRWESQVNGEIVIPTSGGFDSRILNYCIRDRDRIKAFTYGVSNDQSKSSEVVYAKALSNKLGIEWDHIELGEFHKFIPDWLEIYSASTHAHGMYHMEFFSKVSDRVNKNSPLLSGITGGGWAGGVIPPSVNTPEELTALGYTHGMNANSKYSKLKSDNPLRNTYFESNRQKLQDFRWTVVEMMRLKIILLSYLLRIPRWAGLRPWSPFLDVNVAISMLNLPTERRRNRVWQKEFFARKNIDFESDQGLLNSLSLAFNQNTLNHQAMNKLCPKLLDAELLGQVVDESYVTWINEMISNDGSKVQLRIWLGSLPKIGWGLRRRGVDKRLDAYNAYLTLRPIEYVLKRREDEQ